MTSRQDSGNSGQMEVCERVKCPNCDGKLIQLPPGFPIYDVQCSACLFRAQVKNTKSKYNGKKITGAGWNIINNAMKLGMLIPPVILNNPTEILFYPYIPKTVITKRLANIKSHNRKHWMFDYDVSQLQYYVLLKK